MRLYRESEPTIRRLAEQLNVHHEALRNWIRQAEADAGERHDRPISEMAEENRRLREEVAELRRVNEILRAASSYFASELSPALPGDGHVVHRRTPWPLRGRAPATGPEHRRVDLLPVGARSRAAV
jgi:transposase-like protein